MNASINWQTGLSKLAIPLVQIAAGKAFIVWPIDMLRSQGKQKLSKNVVHGILPE
jgi:hypothetical protein